MINTNRNVAQKETPQPNDSFPLLKNLFLDMSIEDLQQGAVSRVLISHRNPKSGARETCHVQFLEDHSFRLPFHREAHAIHQAQDHIPGGQSHHRGQAMVNHLPRRVVTY